MTTKAHPGDPKRPAQPLLLTVTDAASLLAISRSALYGLIREGSIVSVTIGRSRRIPSPALDRYIQELMTP